MLKQESENKNMSKILDNLEHYKNNDTGETLNYDQMFDLYTYYIDNDLIEDNGFADFLNGATDDATGLYKIV